MAVVTAYTGMEKVTAAAAVILEHGAALEVAKKVLVGYGRVSVTGWMCGKMYWDVQEQMK